MSPWDSAQGDPGTLRPRRGAALIVASFQRPRAVAMSEVVPAAHRIVDRRTCGRRSRPTWAGSRRSPPPSRRTPSTPPTSAELLVAPILILVLLLVFRTPVAATIPLLIGAAPCSPGRGLLLLSTFAMPVNSLAVAIASMMGLALGVDYALLMVSRFRQERDAGADLDSRDRDRGAGRGADHRLRRRHPGAGDGDGGAGRSRRPARLGRRRRRRLHPAQRPAGDLADAGAAPRAGRRTSTAGGCPASAAANSLLGLAARLIARPWIAIPLIVLPMIAIAAPASALSIGPPDPRQLPPSDPTRQGFEALRRAIGPGWAAPIVVVATAREGAISDPGRLEAISRWQDRIARDPDVAAVIGPAVAGRERKARSTGRAAPTARCRSGSPAPSEASPRCAPGCSTRATASTSSATGSARPPDGAATIAGRTREAQGGAERLEAGLGRASAGATRLSSGLDRAAARAPTAWCSGQRRLSKGAGRLARGVRRLDDTLRGSLGQLQEISARLRAWSAWLRSLRAPTEMAAEQLERAVEELEAMTVGQEDPRYAELLAAIQEASALVGLPAGAAPGASGRRRCRPGSPALWRRRSSASRSSSPGRWTRWPRCPTSFERLAAGVGRLRKGADQVAAGARQSERGGRALRARAAAAGARGAAARPRPRRRARRRRAPRRAGWARSPPAPIASPAGCGRAGANRRAGRRARPAAGAAEPLRDDAARLRSRLPHAASPLARGDRLRLPDADRARRDRAGDARTDRPGRQRRRRRPVGADAGRAGRRARAPRRPRRLSDRLQEELPALARASATGVEIGEGAQSLADYTDATMARLPWLVVALSFVAILMLIAVLRSLLLPVVAVALNLLTIAAAFGALQLFFGLDLLVGPRYIDAISAAGVLTIMFVLSIDYEVFLLTRMREAWLRTRGPHPGDRRTASATRPA